MKMKLAQFSLGRVVLHTICLLRDRKFHWHWDGICREFQYGFGLW
jgi:hypothetical protein